MGIRVESAVQDVEISGNSIHDNNGLGIDLLPVTAMVGVTPNDLLDGDSGGNGLQNFPVLTAATSSSAGTDIGGTLSSTPGETYRLEFFATPACDANGHGEGRTFLGWTMVTTDASGSASFATHVQARSTGVVTATATRLSSHATSEFSACAPVVIAPCTADLDGNGMVDGADLGLLLGAWGSMKAPADLDGNGAVDGTDLGELLSQWGSCP